MRVVGIGGCNLDILGVPDGEMALRDSNPGTVAFRPGGVTCNILRRLSLKGYETCLITALGQGPLADELEKQCSKDGVRLDHALRNASQPGIYLCLHENSGEMLCAVSAMSAMEALTPKAALEALEKAGPADAFVVDCNLREDTLAAVCAFLYGKGLLFMDPVSARKGIRARSVYRYLDAFKPNRLEARALSGETDIDAAAAYFRAQGVKRVFISLGPGGTWYRGEGGGGLCPTQPLTGRALTTGAGDALCAGIIDALLKGASTEEAARRGNLWAREALEE